MAKVTMAQMKEMAKVAAVASFAVPESAEQVGSFTYAVPVEVEGQEVWVEVAFTAKQWYATKVAEAYDPFEKQVEWKAEMAEREAKAEAKAKAKAEKEAKKAKKAE